jgi:hypothetical protein
MKVKVTKILYKCEFCDTIGERMAIPFCGLCGQDICRKHSHMIQIINDSKPLITFYICKPDMEKFAKLLDETIIKEEEESEND